MSIYAFSYDNHRLYDEISRNISAHKQKVNISGYDNDSVLAVYTKVLSENPDGIFYKVGSIKIMSSLLGSSLLLNRVEDKRTVFNFAELVAERNKIVRIAQNERNNYNAIMAVYRYFVNHYRYSDYDDETFHQIYSPLQKPPCCL